MSLQVNCDGCDLPFAVGELTFLVDYGNHECRYCPPCAEMYESWRTLTTIEEARRQREFDLWQLENRPKVPLKRMPIDFPTVKRGKGPPVILG